MPFRGLEAGVVRVLDRVLLHANPGSLMSVQQQAIVRRRTPGHAAAVSALSASPAFRAAMLGRPGGPSRRPGARRRRRAELLQRLAPRVALWLLLLLPVLLPFVAQAQGSAPGIRAFSEGRYADARRELRAASESDPADPAAPLYLGQIALAEGDGAEGARWLERAVKNDAKSASAHWWLGRAYARQATRASRLQQLSLARKIRSSFERAIALDPGHVEARADLMRFHLVAPGIAGGDASEARRQAREIAKRSAWRGHLADGAVAERGKDAARAEREYRAAVALAPDSADAYVALGTMLERAGRHAEAIALYDALLKRQPDSPIAHYQVGRTVSTWGKELDRGAASLERYVARAPAPGDPSLASAWYRLGMVQEKRGDRAAARRAYERVLALDPRQDDARKALARVR